MKTNAIIRIVLFSITILLLLAILAAGLTLRHWERILKPIAASPLETAIPTPLEDTVTPADDARTQEGVRCFPADQIRELDIDWAAGSVAIQAGDVEAIEVYESGLSDAKYAMQIQQQGSKLSIRYCEDSLFLGLGIDLEKKDLILCVPKDFALDSLEVESASATLTVRDMTIREVEIDTASGESILKNCAIEKLDLDTASGDLRLSGTLDTLECDAASGSVYAALTNVPSRIAMNSASGCLDLTLPEDAGFTVSLDALSGKFASDFATTQQNGRYVCGDGSCRIQMDAMSGDVIIRKGQ